MRILFIGDIVGRAGRDILLNRLPGLRRDWKLDFVVVNGENAAGGFGITEAICGEIIEAGADCVTLGNHAWDQKEALVFIAREPRLIRPLNYPAGTPGRGANLLEAQNGARVLVMNVMGRVFMDPLDDPFAGVERELSAAKHCYLALFVLCTRGDPASPFAPYYAILPPDYACSLPEYCQQTGATPVPAGFSYNSGSNNHFLTVDQLRTLIASESALKIASHG
jgi:hypothetical protein